MSHAKDLPADLPPQDLDFGRAETLTPELLEMGRKLFAGPCEFIWAADNIDGLPPIAEPEFAFAGRSNVGKSSLLNALTHRKALARTSDTPGRTQQLNFFVLGTTLRLVDLPGYGYAAVSKEKVANWTKLMRGFLRGRASLERVYLLVDARHGLKPPDEPMMEDLDRAAQSYQVVLTKTDAVGAEELSQRITQVASALSKHAAAFPHILATSSRTGAGIAELRATITAQVQAKPGR